MADRDEAWFGALYRAHHGDVLRYARRRVPEHEADDVVAEVFTTAWRRRDDVSVDRVWLLATAHHHVQHAARSGARRERVRAAAPGAGVVAPPTGVLLDVTAALRQLSDDDRELLTLVAWEELSPAEAAVVLGCPAATVRVRLFRARRRLAALLDPPARVPAVAEESP